MKKSNVIITVVLAVVSAFLLWLWYWLGFNEVDSPLDLVVSVVWWAVIAAGVVLVYRSEQKRRRQVRTVYLADGRYYNSEAGLRTVQAPLAAVNRTVDFDRSIVLEYPPMLKGASQTPVGFRHYRVPRCGRWDDGDTRAIAARRELT